MPPPSLSDPWLASRQFGIVIDAGSSGSRLQIYSWKDARSVRLHSSEASLHALPTVEKGTKHPDDWQIKAEPGISSFGPNPQGVGQYLEPLINHAKDLIPPSYHRHTPIFLLATAGMRLLPEDQRTAVLDATCNYIYLHSKFVLDTAGVSDETPGLQRCGRSIRVISGEEEGLFGWIAVNYLMNGFAITHKDHDKPTTFGFLDMGGASTQIAFEPILDPAEEARTPDENLVDLRLRLLNGEEIRHQVFVTTWLGFGTNQARQRYIAQAVDEAKRIEGETTSSSETSGTEVETETETETGSTSSEWSDSLSPSSSKRATPIEVQDPCLPKNLVVHDKYHALHHHTSHVSETSVSLVGTGSYSQCLSKTTPLLNKAAPCSRSPCLFNGVHVPPIDFNHHRFIGISEYWYSSQHVFGLGGAFDFEKYEQAAEEFCGRDWQDILKQHREGATPDASKTWGKDVDESQLEMQCFKAAWIVNILGRGLGIPRKSKDWEGLDPEQKDAEVDPDKAEVLDLDHGNVPNTIFQSVDTIKGTAISWTLGKMVLEASKGIPPMTKAARPISDPFGPPRIIDSGSGRLPFPNFDSIEQKLPKAWQRESLGFSAVWLLFYILVLGGLVFIASRLKTQMSTSFRRWRRATTRREKDYFMSDDVGLSTSPPELTRPASPTPYTVSRGPSAFLSYVSSSLRRILPPVTPARKIPRRAVSANLTIITPARAPLRFNSAPSSPPGYGNGSTQPSNGTTIKYTRTSDEPLVSTPPNERLNPNGLSVLSLSRNSSQINLARTLPTPRNIGGFTTPTAGNRTPSVYDDEV